MILSKIILSSKKKSGAAASNSIIDVCITMSSIARNELDGVLLQLGTVYAREFVRRIRSDVLEVFKYFGNLLPKSAKLFQPDGTEPTLLVLRGTIPTIYKLKTYHTPIDIWIPAKVFLFS